MEALIEAFRAGTPTPVVLVRGDLALAQPLAERLVGELAVLWGVEPSWLRQPDELAAVAADLRTYSLFAGGKIVLAISTGVLADRDAAQALLGVAVKAMTSWGGPESGLTGAARGAALQLLQVLRLYEIEPAVLGAERSLAAVPDALFGSGKSDSADEQRTTLTPLLSAALEAGLQGFGEEGSSLVADLLRDGLPDRHLLVLVESAVATKHPLLAALARRGGIVDAGRLTTDRGGGVSGLDRMVADLERGTGAVIEPDATTELARRTLRPADYREGLDKGAVDAESSARLAAEFRKLAQLAGGRPIDRALVETHVQDRGQDEIWPLLDALGEGRSGDALTAISRQLRGADDPLTERLSLISQLGKRAHQLIMVAGAVTVSGVPGDERSYPRFREKVAPRLQSTLKQFGGGTLVTMHAFPLHKLYLAAARRTARELEQLPARALAAERRVKGDSDDPDAALFEFALALAGSPASRKAPGKSSAGRR